MKLNRNSSCCGGSLRRRVKKVVSTLPPNPKIDRGVTIIYLGSGDVKLVGEASGLTYYASDHKRHFKVHLGDADSILRRRDFIMKS